MKYYVEGRNREVKGYMRGTEIEASDPQAAAEEFSAGNVDATDIFVWADFNTYISVARRLTPTPEPLYVLLVKSPPAELA